MSLENPYQPPETNSSITEEPENQDQNRLQKIASAQRQVNYAVLLYLGFMPLNIVLSDLAAQFPLAVIILPVSILIVFLFGIISVYRLAAIFRGPIVAVFYVLGFLVPLLGLLLLVSISGKATKELRKNGIKVGLLGANPNTI